MMRPLVSGPAVVPVRAAGSDSHHNAGRGGPTSNDARSVAVRVRTAGAAIVATALRWWRHRRASFWGPPASALVGAAIGMAVDGPVAAAVLAAYAVAGFVMVRGSAARRAQRKARREASDAVLGLAADLRAGLALGPAWRIAEEALRQAESSLLPGRRKRTRTSGAGPVALVAQRLLAATALAEVCGVPLADVLERLDADLRALDRARAAASSQAAGARASAAVLAVMPLAGVGLGVAVGVDPWSVLLHTPVGALALGLAVTLQLAGLAWTTRLADIEVEP
jgi:tight adherence protein B